MYGFFGRSTNNNAARSKPAEVNFDGELRFTVRHLRHVHTQLVENKVVTSKNLMVVVESLRAIAEMVVYGDMNSEQLFDFFCEKNMLALFIEIMWSPDCPGSVHMQILQTLGILCQSVKNDTSLYYLLSKNYVNEIINYPHNFENENISEHFVSFLKTLSLRLNLQTVQFFFIEETGAFPLLTRAIGLLQFREPMVRIAAQAIILNVYKVPDKRSRDYALQPEIMNRFFKNISQIMIGQYNGLVALCVEHTTIAVRGQNAGSRSNSPVDKKAAKSLSGRSSNSPSNPISDEMASAKLEELLHDLLINIEDWFFYLQDVIDLGIMRLRRALIQYIVVEFVYPILVEPLNRMHTAGGGGNVTGENVYRSRRASTGLVHHRTRSRDSSVSMSTDPESVSFSTQLVVTLMYSQMMLRHIPDEMMRRALMVVLLHPLSRKRRKRILVALEKGMEVNGSHQGDGQGEDAISQTVRQGSTSGSSTLSRTSSDSSLFSHEDGDSDDGDRLEDTDAVGGLQHNLMLAGSTGSGSRPMGIPATTKITSKSNLPVPDGATKMAVGEPVAPGALPTAAAKIRIKPDYFSDSNPSSSGNSPVPAGRAGVGMNIPGVRSAAMGRSGLPPIGGHVPGEGGEDDGDFADSIRDSSFCFRKTMTLSTADFGGSNKTAARLALLLNGKRKVAGIQSGGPSNGVGSGLMGFNDNPHSNCPDKVSYCGGVCNSRHNEHLNINRCSVQCCLIGNTERYNLLSLLMLHGVSESWMTHAMTAKILPFSPRNAIQQSTKQTAVAVSPKAAATYSGNGVVLQSPGELASTALWYMHGLHYFPDCIAGALTEIHEMLTLAGPTGLKKSRSRGRTMSSSLTGTSQISSSFYVQMDAVGIAGGEERELSDNGSDSGSDSVYDPNAEDDDDEYYHKANRPIPEECDDVDTYDILLNTKTEEVSGTSSEAVGSAAVDTPGVLVTTTTTISSSLSHSDFIDPDVVGTNRLELLSIAYAQAKASKGRKSAAGAFNPRFNGGGAAFSASFTGRSRLPTPPPSRSLGSLDATTVVAGGSPSPPLTPPLLPVTMTPIVQGSNGGNMAVVETLMHILYDAPNHTLTSLQVAANTLYSILRLLHLTTLNVNSNSTTVTEMQAIEKKTGVAGSVPIAYRNFLLQKQSSITHAAAVCIKWHLYKIQGAYIQAVKVVLERAHSSKGDSLLNILQEELRRANNSKWSSTVGKMGQDLLLLLMPTPAVILRMGLEHSIPISQMEMIRREVQVLLLLRSLVKHTLLLMPDALRPPPLPNSAEAAAAAIAPVDAAARTTGNDLFKDIVDEELLPFSEKGSTAVVGGGLSRGPSATPSAPSEKLEVRDGHDHDQLQPQPHNQIQDPELAEGSVIQTANYIFVKATTVLYYSVGGSDSGNATTPSRFLTPLKSSTNASSAGLASGGGGGVSVGVVSGMLVMRKIGEILFILNNTKLLLATPNEDDDGATAVVRVVAPIIHTDVSVDSSDKRSLRLLVRSYDPVSLMSRVGGESADMAAYLEPTSPSSSTSGKGGSSSGGAGSLTLITNTSGIQGGSTSAPSAVMPHIVSRQQIVKQSPCALSIRMQSTLWQMNLQFDTTDDCSGAARHVEIRRQQERLARLSLLKSSLSSWIESNSNSIANAMSPSCDTK